MAKPNADTLFLMAWQLCDGDVLYNPHTGKAIEPDGPTHKKLLEEVETAISTNGGLPLINLAALAKSAYFYPNKRASKKTAKTTTPKVTTPKKTAATPTCKTSVVVPITDCPITEEDKKFLKVWEESKGTINPTTMRVLNNPQSQVALTCQAKAQVIKAKLGL